MSNFEAVVLFLFREYDSRWAEIRQTEGFGFVLLLFEIAVGLALMLWGKLQSAYALMVFVVVCVWLKAYSHTQMHRSGRYAEEVENLFRQLAVLGDTGMSFGWHHSRARFETRRHVGVTGTVSFVMVQLGFVVYACWRLPMTDSTVALAIVLGAAAVVGGFLLVMAPKAGASQLKEE